MSDTTPAEHAYLVAAEQARQMAEDAIHNFEAIAADFAAIDPEGYSHYASLFESLEDGSAPSEPPAPKEPLTLPGPRPTSLDGPIREMLAEDRARRGVA